MVPQLGEAVTAPTLLVPFRRSDSGWFDYNPMVPSIPMALWHHGNDSADLQRLVELRARVDYDWRTVRSFRDKEEAGHEEPWFAFLAGDNPDYPEKILAAATPSGGAGAAASVAALVSGIDPAATVVELVNLGPEQDRTVIVQAGAFAEHTIAAMRSTACEDGSWLGSLYDYGHGEPEVIERHAEIGGPWLTVRLPASTRIRLVMRLALRSRKPSYATPFDESALRGTDEEGGPPADHRHRGTRC